MTAPDDIKAFFTGLFAAFPDWEFEILELARAARTPPAAGGRPGRSWARAASRASPRPGARRDRGLRHAPGGGGPIVENNAYMNGAVLAQQLGLLPQQGSTADRMVTGAFNAKTAADGHDPQAPRPLRAFRSAAALARPQGRLHAELAVARKRAPQHYLDRRA